MKRTNTKIDKKTPPKKNMVVFWVILCVLLPVFTVIWTFYGPFESARRIWICTAMSTANHKYLATAFFSKKTIDKYTAEYFYSIGDLPEQDFSLVTPQTTKNQITVENVSIGLARGKLMRISNPAKIDVAVSNYIGNSGTTLDNLIRQEKAVAGINAGAYADKLGSAHGSVPDGVLIKDSNLVYSYNTDDDDICVIGFDENNILTVKYVKSAEEANSMNFRCAVSFGPPLIINGEGLVKESGTSLQPRSAIAQCSDGSVLFLVLDGRQASSAGATLKNVQDLLLEYGAVTAANLDGGSSTAMIHQGKLLNSPSDKGELKKIPSAFVVKE